jgi:hypothetical protein
MRRFEFVLAVTAFVLPSCTSDENDGSTASAGHGGTAAVAGVSGAAAGRVGTGGAAGRAGGAPGSNGGALANAGVGGGSAGTVAGATSTAGAGGTGNAGRASVGGVGGAGTGSGADAGAGQGGEGMQAGMGPTYWQPKAGLSWQWQLSESVTDVVDVDVYDIDWESDADVVSMLHAQGKKVICYVSVGSWEDFRPDAGDFPDAVIGNDYDGWPGEKYLDIRSEETRARMLARFDICQAKGFDAVEPDNMDVFELGSDSGFPLSRADGVSYAEWLAEVVHARGMGIGQKNASELTDDIEAIYDWALTESCYSDGDWCGDVSAYADHDKPVFMCEYEQGSFANACSTWQARGYSPILKDMDLGADVTFCP